MKAVKQAKLSYYVHTKDGSPVTGPFENRVDANTARASYKQRTGKQAFVVVQGQ